MMILIILLHEFTCIRDGPSRGFILFGIVTYNVIECARATVGNFIYTCKQFPIDD